MRFSGVLVKSLKMLVMAAVFFLSVLLASCSQELQLPKDVDNALTVYWQSLPSASTIEHEIIRAWPGDTSNVPENEREIWCVETEISSAEDFGLIGEEMVWIVFRDNEESSWSTYLLAAMSSLWPYEACKQDGFVK